VRRIATGKLEFPLVRSGEDFRGATPPVIKEAQEAVTWAQHLVILYPLWMGTMPAVLKAFFEQVFRYGFAMGPPPKGSRMPARLLKGRSARIIITMGMPGFVYRWYFGAHSLKIVQRNILGLAGIRPAKASLIGGVEGDAKRRERWLQKIEALGRAGE
jgi:putative NADPH-quinone reductase